MKKELEFKHVDTELPEVNNKVLCLTSNGNYFISEMYLPHDGYGKDFEGRPKEWKGSSKTTKTIKYWAYLPKIEEL